MGSTMGSGMGVEWEYRMRVEWEVLYFYPILQPILLPLFFHSTPPFYKFELFHVTSSSLRMRRKMENSLVVYKEIVASIAILANAKIYL